MATIYDRVAALGRPPGRIAAISIPAWSYVPAANEYGGSDRVHALTDMFNDAAEREARARGLSWVDITDASTSGLGSRGWIAADDLHPGDAQYGAWADAIWEAVKASWLAAAGMGA